MQQRHQKALNDALAIIKASDVSSFIQSIYLYGSCSRNEEQWNSDVDLFVEFKDSFDILKYKRQVLRLRSDVNAIDIIAPEVDVHFSIGTDWKDSSLEYYNNIRKDGIKVWENSSNCY